MGWEVQVKVNRRRFLAAASTAAALGQRLKGAGSQRKVYVVPNFHPASCGWLTTFSKERVFCANSYLNHLDRVRDDPSYAFVLSEVNNMIAIMNFRPERVPELKQRIQEGRVELVNAFFLESTINLSGGEALARLGAEGLRWQQKVFGVRPRFAWTIDVCGTHDQMAQITSGLGLEAMVYTRKNPTGKALHWALSPDGSRTLAISPGHYSELSSVFKTQDPLTPKELDEVAKFFDEKQKITPDGAPVLVLGGNDDYALAPTYQNYPREFIAKWKERDASTEIRFSTLSKYLDAVLPDLKSGAVKIPTMPGGTAYDFDAFWIESPRMKSWFRRNEHALQSAEMLSTLASLQGRFVYPADTLYKAWAQMFLSMDRNSLWGSAGGMVFEDPKSWDVRDRLTWVEKESAKALADAGSAVLVSGDAVGVFNPANWKRSDPFVIHSPMAPEAARSQTLGDGSVLCEMELQPCSAGGWKLAQPSAEKSIPLPDLIETDHYLARVSAQSGALVSLKLKPGGREVLGAPANVLVAEKPKSQSGDPGDFILPRPERNRLASSIDYPARISVTTGPIATTVSVESEFLGGKTSRRLMRFYQHHPRIDFETEFEDLPDLTVLVAEFPLAGNVDEVRRGIPFGFSHGAWAKPNPDLHGWTKGIVPAVRWSHYALAGGGGVALFDRGISGREINGNTPIVYLYNATDKYYGHPNPWLSGAGKHKVSYALMAHEGEWAQARVPQAAWEYNCPPVLFRERTTAVPKSFLQTSPNVIVEALHRDGNEIELRMAECMGSGGNAEVLLDLPHKGAWLTDLTGARRKPLTGGPRYRFAVRPQQIVTLRFGADSAVPVPEPIKQWDDLVPPEKLPALHEYSDQKGHPRDVG
jgi:alpha-mannosidase